MMQCVASVATPQNCNALLPHSPDGTALLLAFYQLDKETEERAGGVATCAVATVPDTGAVTVGAPVPLGPGGLPGVFDVRPTPSGAILLALTDGSVATIAGNKLADRVTVAETMTTSACELAPGVTLSTHHGGGAVLSGRDGAALRRWTAHEFDAWYCCPDTAASPAADRDSAEAGDAAVPVTGAFTAGDDGRVCRWDFRTDLAAPVATARHDAGATFVAPLGGAAGGGAGAVFVTGSYDETVAVRDVRKWAKPVDTATVGGGAWRVRQAGDTLYVAAMQGGATTLAVGADGSLGKPTPAFHTGDAALVYDIAVLGDASLVATTSFYENTVKLWRPASVDP